MYLFGDMGVSKKRRRPLPEENVFGKRAKAK
jgi:hypothetical protein